MPATVVALLVNAAKRLKVPLESVMDVGCNVGGVALQLASHASSVLAVDGSAEAIRVANDVKATGTVPVVLRVRIVHGFQCLHAYVLTTCLLHRERGSRRHTWC